MKDFATLTTLSHWVSLLAVLPLLSFLLATLPAQANDSETTTQPKTPLTLSDIFGTNAPDWDRGGLPDIVGWMPDGQYWVQRTDYGLAKVHARTGAMAMLFDTNRIHIALAESSAPEGHGPRTEAKPARVTNFRADSRFSAVLVERESDVLLYDLKSGEAVPLTQSPQIREQNATFSPDGNRIAFVRNGNLFVAPRINPKDGKPLTQDGNEAILNGRLDWVYEEEVYGRGQTTGYWWSPDSKHIAFLRIDDRPIQPFQIVDHLPQLQNVENWRYPKAGTPNPVVTLGIVAIDGKSPAKFVDLSAYPEADRLIVRVDWTPDSKHVIYQVQNRIATFLDLNLAEVGTGKSKRVLRETTEAWVEIIDNPHFLKDGSFLWLSERDGRRHIYRYKTDGTLVKRLTEGEWDAKGIRTVNEDEGFIAFTSNEYSPTEDHLYRINLDGSERKRISQERGSHNPTFSPDGRLFLDRHSTYGSLPTLTLCDGATGNPIRLVADNTELESVLSRFQEPKSEFLQVKARDGFVMEAQIIRPANFDPQKKYPVYMSVYGGPGAQTVRNSWRGGVGMFERMLTEKGIIVWKCDNRSASGKGAKSAWACYKQLGVSELADIEDSLTYLKSLPYIDGSRIGISGWSYGGFLTAYALTHSKSFKMGIAGAGVHDWTLYDTIYTERYMDTPQNNPQGYKIASCVEAAKDCAGRLLLLHGMMDDNVHLQNSVQLMYALQKAGKDFDIMFYPSPASRHGIGDRDLNKHLRQVELEFIQKNL
ncbi:MAG: S9 family peptidase [Armatimonadaceae bacterium]